MKVWVENYNDAKKLVPTEPTIAIRVFDPGARPYKLAHAAWPEEYPDDCWDNTPAAPFDRDAYLAVFEYTFEDFNFDSLTNEDDKTEILSDPSRTFFSPEMAEDLLTRFQKSYKDATGFMTHCNAGSSRSVALARAIIRIFSLEAEFQSTRGKRLATERFKDFNGNDHVYRLMLEAAVRLEIP